MPAAAPSTTPTCVLPDKPPPHHVQVRPVLKAPKPPSSRHMDHLVGAGAGDHGRPSLPEDLQVKSERPVIHIAKI